MQQGGGGGASHCRFAVPGKAGMCALYPAKGEEKKRGLLIRVLEPWASRSGTGFLNGPSVTAFALHLSKKKECIIKRRRKKE